MAANRVVVARSSISRDRSSQQVIEKTVGSVGPAQSSRVADAIDLR
jgi:hypothetical protein